LSFCGLLWFLCVVEAVLAHRTLYPDRKAKRWTKALTCLVSPASTMRAADALARDAVLHFHPLAVVSVACAAPTLAKLAKVALLDARHRPPASTSLGDEVWTWFAPRLTARLEDLARSAGLQPAELVAPPVAEPDARSYCPRCQGQFFVTTTTCASCGLPTEEFHAAAAPRQDS
jgi:hypothetical protein